MSDNMWYQLPPDMATWNTAVIGNVARKLPEITNYISAVTWSRLDPATGDADGLIELLGGTCAAPVIIRANKMAPIDILVTSANGDTKFYPLSAAFLQKIYADNVLGKPVSNLTDRDEDYVGPSQRVRNIKTVDAVKYASKEAVEHIYNELIKSASVVNWMFTQMPEAMIALHDRATNPDVEKTASPEMPDLLVAWKDHDTYKCNGEVITADVVNELFKVANATEEERTNFMNGVPFVRDNREKIAKLVVPRQEDFIASEVADAMGRDSSGSLSSDGEAMFTSIQLKSGKMEAGILFRNGNDQIDERDITRSMRSGYTSDNSSIISDYDASGRYAKYLFVSNNGYALAPSFVHTPTVTVPINYIFNNSEPSEPALGMVGMVLSKYSMYAFGAVTDIFDAGKYKKVTVMNYLTDKPYTFNLGVDSTFFEVNGDRLDPAATGMEVPTVSFTGINGTLARDNEGNLVLEGTTYSKINCPYALMSKYAASYEDAVEVTERALKTGKCVFDAVEMVPIAKIAARNDNQADKTKVDNKKTRQGTDDQTQAEDAADQAAVTNPSLASVSPEMAMSIDLANDTNMGFGIPTAGRVRTVTPVTSTDLENVVQINSPEVMDAYLVGNLANGSATSETLMKASDSIVDALSQLSQLLFLVRQEKYDFLSEADVQAAMNKLTDVASAIGVGTIPGNI